jgi:hypothetical protein
VDFLSNADEWLAAMSADVFMRCSLGDVKLPLPLPLGLVGTAFLVGLKSAAIAACSTITARRKNDAASGACRKVNDTPSGLIDSFCSTTEIEGALSGTE